MSKIDKPQHTNACHARMHTVADFGSSEDGACNPCSIQASFQQCQNVGVGGGADVTEIIVRRSDGVNS